MADRLSLARQQFQRAKELKERAESEVDLERKKKLFERANQLLREARETAKSAAQDAS